MSESLREAFTGDGEGDEAVINGWRVLTVRQPWASCIVPGGKEIENRATTSARWKWRGPLAIHAGAGWSPRGAADERVRSFFGQPGLGRGSRRWALDQGVSEATKVFPMSAVVSIAVVDDIHVASGCHRPWGEDRYVRANGTVQTDVAHLHLVHVVELPEPIPYVYGGLGLRKPSVELGHKLTDFAASIEWDGFLWPL